MRNLMIRYKANKFRRFVNGLIFAMLSLVAIFLCVYFLKEKSATRLEIILPFVLSIISMLFGFVSMFKTVPGTD